MDTLEKPQIKYPSVLLKIHGELYSISSKNVSSILQLPKFKPIPNAPENILGVFPFRGEAVPLIDMRIVFNMPTLKQEYQEFSQMLETRKQDHITWVKTLEDSIKTKKPFTLATDPHKCAFGKWYDNYKSENNAINFHLRKLDEPHKNLHRAAEETVKCEEKCDECTRNECKKVTLEHAKEIYMPTIIHLLDEAKELFKTIYHEMVLVLNDGRQIGIVVDEVLAVEDLEEFNGTGKNLFSISNSSNFINGIMISPKTKDLILELDDKELLNTTNVLSELKPA